MYICILYIIINNMWRWGWANIAAQPRQKKNLWWRTCRDPRPWGQVCTKTEEITRICKPHGISIPFCRENIWETMAFFFGGYHIFRQSHFFQTFKHWWSSKARPHHLLLPPGSAVARKHPMRNLCPSIYDSAAVLPHSVWQSVAIYFTRMEH